MAKRFSEQEVLYITQHYQYKTDNELGRELGRDPMSISRKRLQLGLKKGVRKHSGDVTNIEERSPRAQLKVYEILAHKEPSKKDRKIYFKLDPDEKRKLFEIKFRQSARVRVLKQTLGNSEYLFYVERFLDYMYTFETLLETEEDTLHLAIMELVRCNRILIRQKAIRDLIDSGEKNTGVGVEILDRQYKDSLESYNKMMASLNGTRSQRVAKNDESKFTLITLVQQIMDEEKKIKVGESAAIINAAVYYAAKDMRARKLLMD